MALSPHLLLELRQRLGQVCLVSQLLNCLNMQHVSAFALVKLAPRCCMHGHVDSRACRCRTDVARVERISCEQGLFISPATLQGFKSRSLKLFFSRTCVPAVAALKTDIAVVLLHACFSVFVACHVSVPPSADGRHSNVVNVCVCLLQLSRSLLITPDMSGPTLQHIQHLHQ